MDIHQSPDAATLARHAAKHIAHSIQRIIAERGVCHLALAGGSTPEATYIQMRNLDIDWHNVHFWFGDERCLPLSDPDRNDTMAISALLKQLPIAPDQIHPIQAELGPIDAAKAYSAEISRIGRLDIILLGIGEDGHTASLFPNNAALELASPAIPVFNAPKPPAERVSLSLSTIWEADERIVLVSGAGKHQALTGLVCGEPLPAAMIGSAIWFIDAAAFTGNT